MRKIPWPSLIRDAMRVLGLALIFISLLVYRSNLSASYDNRLIFGLWSYRFFALIIVFLFIFLFNILVIAKKNIKYKFLHNSNRSNSAYFDLGILIIGISYFVATIDSPQNGGRLAWLNLFGSTVPVSIILEWLALVLFSVGILLFVFTRLGTQWKNAILVICSIYSCILIGEGFIRIKALILPQTQGFPTYTDQIWYHRYVEWNQAGFRDSELLVKKRKGIKRLLVVGDSFAFGNGIEQIKDRFGEQLAKKLTKKTSFEWESINASKGNTHTLQHIDILQNNLAYDPDIVILLYVFNDIVYLKKQDSRVVKIKNPVEQRETSSLKSRFNPIGILWRNSYLFQELFIHIRLLKWRYRKALDSDNPYNDQALLDRHFEDIAKFVESAKQGDTIVTVVPFDFVPKDRGEYNNFLADGYDNFIATANKFGISVLPIRTAFEGYSVSELRLSKFDGHPNELANHIAAEAVLDSLIEFIKD